VKKLLFSFIVIAIGITIFAGQRQIRDLARVSSGFTEGDMLIAKEEEPGGYYQPNWATDNLNVRGVGRVPFCGDAYDVFNKGIALWIISLKNTRVCNSIIL